MEHPTLYAFWKYDQFPYCRWGEIDRWVEDKVGIKSYGYGFLFKPFLILPKEAALVKINAMDALTFDYAITKNLAKADYDHRLTKVISIPS